MLVVAIDVWFYIAQMWMPKSYAIAANGRFGAYGRILRSRHNIPLIFTLREQSC